MKKTKRLLCALITLALCFSSLGMTMAEGSTPEPTPSAAQAGEETPTPTGEATPTNETTPTPTPTTEAAPTPTDEAAPTPTGEPTPTATTAPASNNRIGGTVWVDANEDGARDSSESVLAGFTVSLYTEGDLTNVVATAKTDADGAYAFADVTPGRYVLCIQAQTIGGVEYLLPFVGYTGDNQFMIADDWINACTKTIAVEADSAITNLHTGVRTPPAMQLLMLAQNTPSESAANPATNETQLAAAITAANAAADADTIYISGDIELTSELPYIAKTLTIIGAGQSSTGIKLGGAQNFRHFASDDDITLTLKSMTLTGINNTSSGGGGVYASSIATLTNCTVSGNTANTGGGVWAGNATIRGSIVAGNTAGTGANVYANSASWTDDGLTGAPAGYES